MTDIHIRKTATTLEGEGAEVNRLMPIAGFRNFDPFVLWDHFTIEPGNGFPDHPHRGFEAITYLFQGAIEHADNLGNQSTVTSGGAQRFTAGKGIVHSEMPSTDGQTRGIQLWINLPKRLKSIEPDYQQADVEDIPVHVQNKASVRTIVGENGPVRLKSDVIYLHVDLDKNGEFEQILPADYRGIVYAVNGEAAVNGNTLSATEAATIQDTNLVKLSSIYGGRFMLAFGKPHNEPIKQWGPYVD